MIMLYAFSMVNKQNKLYSAIQKFLYNLFMKSFAQLYDNNDSSVSFCRLKSRYKILVILPL